MTTMSPIRGGVLHLPTSQEGRYSQSLERGLAILRAFSPEHPHLGVEDGAHRAAGNEQAHDSPLRLYAGGA